MKKMENQWMWTNWVGGGSCPPQENIVSVLLSIDCFVLILSNIVQAPDRVSYQGLAATIQKPVDYKSS